MLYFYIMVIYAIIYLVIWDFLHCMYDHVRTHHSCFQKTHGLCTLRKTLSWGWYLFHDFPTHLGRGCIKELIQSQRRRWFLVALVLLDTGYCFLSRWDKGAGEVTHRKRNRFWSSFVFTHFFTTLPLNNRHFSNSVLGAPSSLFPVVLWFPARPEYFFIFLRRASVRGDTFGRARVAAVCHVGFHRHVRQKRNELWMKVFLKGGHDMFSVGYSECPKETCK